MQKLIPALLFAVLALVSCTKSNDDQAKVQNDTWYVAFFEAPVNGTVILQDQTVDFTGYIFEFNDNNEWIIHSPSGTSTTAQWGDDQVNSTIGLKMTTPFSPVDKLLGNWKIVEQTTESLELTQTAIASNPDAYTSKVIFKKQ